MSELLWKSTPVLLYPQALYGTTKQSESLPFSCSRSFAVQISNFSTTKASNHQISSTTLSRCCQTLFQHHFMSENCLRLPNICVLCFGDFFPLSLFSTFIDWSQLWLFGQLFLEGQHLKITCRLVFYRNHLMQWPVEDLWTIFFSN